MIEHLTVSQIRIIGGLILEFKSDIKYAGATRHLASVLKPKVAAPFYSSPEIWLLCAN